MSAVLDRNLGAGFATYVWVFSLINQKKSVLFQYLQSKVATWKLRLQDGQPQPGADHRADQPVKGIPVRSLQGRFETNSVKY